MLHRVSASTPGFHMFTNERRQNYLQTVLLSYTNFWDRKRPLSILLAFVITAIICDSCSAIAERMNLLSGLRWSAILSPECLVIEQINLGNKNLLDFYNWVHQNELNFKVKRCFAPPPN